ncbi:MAG TPA: radical SAM protein [Bacteroidales bacterium]|nr:radical SAM protein [Bacteroidales bacterium]HPJ60256.1 radical SAM protein [Bacteroidales bacterium]HPR11864.1 radical SAM protein [Bacteroidales bacterium]
MPTFLFDKIVFGPVKSRRLGVSLGINLLPVNRKVCNFNCIYCECGLTQGKGMEGEKLPPRQQVYEALESTLSEMKKNGQAPDVITYAGNGEPTLHPEFPGIIDDSIILRDRYFPQAKIAVLSNSTLITRPAVREALLKVDSNILKLDSAFHQTILSHNQPNVKIDTEKLINDLASFNGRLIIQTLFVRGIFHDRTIDNTTPSELEAWLAALRRIRPSEVMIYTISRDTPENGKLIKVPLEELNHIAAMVSELGIKTQVSG